MISSNGTDLLLLMDFVHFTTRNRVYLSWILSKFQEPEGPGVHGNVV